MADDGHITSALIHSAAGILTTDLQFDGVGDVHACQSNNLLSYLKLPEYIGAVSENEHISGVFCLSEFAAEIRPTIKTIICEDPTHCFFSIVDCLGKSYLTNKQNSINSTFDYSSVKISDFGVTIGKRLQIESNVTIHPGVVIGDDVILRSGAVLGLDSFQHQRTTKGIISPRHNGYLIIENEVEIGANCSISKGFSYRNTSIGRGTKVDAQSYIAHGANIGAGNIICAGARIMGHVKIGSNAFIGPGAVIASRVKIGDCATISLGSVVSSDIDANAHVTGNFAVPHLKFLEWIKSFGS